MTIFPASETLIRKYSAQSYYMVRETAQMYEEVVKPNYITGMDMKHCNWIYNVLEGKAEVDLRVLENEHFML